MDPVRIVVVDDHDIWRRGVQADLGDGFEVVGEATDAPSAIEVITATRPDVVLCDLHMPGGGLDVALRCGTTTSIVMLTVSEAERDVLDAVSAGAIGYLVKSTSPGELREAIAAAARGEPVFSPSLAALVLGEFRRLARSSGPDGALTEREKEVLRLVARGHPYKRIGEELFISPKTVENHVRNILAKLQLTRRDELIHYAARHRLDD